MPRQATTVHGVYTRKREPLLNPTCNPVRAAAQSVARFRREVWPIELQRPQCGAVYALVDLTLRAMGGTRCEFFTQLVQKHHTIVKPIGSIVLFHGNSYRLGERNECFDTV
jgi:hypothetical protein